MARSSAKKPGEPKCRGSHATVEGRDWVRIGGSKWLREVAEQKGKFIPLEYRSVEAGGKPRKKASEAPPPPPPAAEPEAPAEEAPAEEPAEAVAAE